MTLNDFMGRAGSVNAEHGNASHLCRRCGELVVSLTEDGRCYDGCEAPPLDEERIAEAHRKLHRETAEMLHRMGFHDRAAWHEGRASR